MGTESKFKPIAHRPLPIAEEKEMRCEHCHGLMVVDHFLDMQDTSGHLWLRAWRCMNCGPVVEPGMLRRRETHGSMLARLHARLSKRPVHRVEAVPLGV